MKEKNSYAKTCIVNFPPGNIHISKEGGGDSNSHLSDGKFFYEKVKAIFPGKSTTRGKGYSLTDTLPVANGLPASMV